MIDKQFWCLNGYESETSVIVDGKFAPTNGWLCDKLNELVEENDVLKQQLKTKYVVNKQYEELQKIKEENQYLREILDIGETNAKAIVDVLNIQQDRIKELTKENEELKQHIKKLEKQIYLIHMSSMFSTVQSFKGDVSKRYYYSEKTDRIYDTANTYGQYDKILDKKEIAMLLNEYETLLNERDME